MTSVFTYGAFGRNPMAEKYGQLAAAASKCGSKNFVYTKVHDDRHPQPRHHHRQSDVPWRDSFTFQRYRWMMHDFRMFGLWGALRKHYYIGDSWRRKDEKIFVGKDDIGNKFWLSRRTSGSIFTRLIEPRDPHWFRGQHAHTSSMEWVKWLQGNTAHTPAQMKARGEYGANAGTGKPIPFDIKYNDWSPLVGGAVYTREPSYVPTPGAIMNPDRRTLEESGYTRWVHNQGMPLYMPFCGVQDYPDELLEEYHRGQWPFGRRSKGNDHDEWKN